MSEQYTRLYDRALAKMPKKTSSGERFELPKPASVMVGSRTIVQNFGDICDRLNRDTGHVMKFLAKEMATAASLDGSRAIFQGRFNTQSISRLLDIYCGRYVICPICNRPDTKIVKEARFYFLACEACGAKSSVPPA